MARRKLETILADLHDSITALIVKVTDDTREWQQERFEDIGGMINQLSPVRIDLTQELADAILDRIRGPLTITKEASDWLKTLAPTAPTLTSHPIGFTSNAGLLYIRITPDGTLGIEIRNLIGQDIWRGEFTPPGYRKGPTS